MVPVPLVLRHALVAREPFQQLLLRLAGRNGHHVGPRSAQPPDRASAVRGERRCEPGIRYAGLRLDQQAPADEGPLAPDGGRHLGRRRGVLAGGGLRGRRQQQGGGDRCRKAVMRSAPAGSSLLRRDAPEANALARRWEGWRVIVTCSSGGRPVVEADPPGQGARRTRRCDPRASGQEGRMRAHGGNRSTGRSVRPPPGLSMAVRRRAGGDVRRSGRTARCCRPTTGRPGRRDGRSSFIWRR